MAMDGGILGGRCYPSQVDTLDAYYSAMSAAQTPGSTSYVNEFVKESGVWKIKGYSVDTSGVWTLRYATNAPVPVFTACDPAQSFTDGVTVGWGIATALVVVSAVTLMKRAARAG
jgi:hypothetical protein